MAFLNCPEAIDLREGGGVFVPLNCLLFAVLKEETQHWTRKLPLRMGNFLRGKQLILLMAGRMNASIHREYSCGASQHPVND